MNMYGDTFAKHMGGLISYFKTKLSDDQKYLYQKALGFIPNIALEDITNGIIENRRPTPGNFPTIAEIKGEWWIWQKQHPGKVENRQFKPIPCEACGSKGVLSFIGPIPLSEHEIPVYRHPITLTAICADCDNWRQQLGNIDGCRRMSKKYIEDQGWELWPYPKHMASRKQKFQYKTTAELGRAVGQEVNDNVYNVDYSDPRFNDRREQLRRQAEELKKQDEIPF